MFDYARNTHLLPNIKRQQVEGSPWQEKSWSIEKNVAFMLIWSDLLLLISDGSLHLPKKCLLYSQLCCYCECIHIIIGFLHILSCVFFCYTSIWTGNQTPRIATVHHTWIPFHDPFKITTGNGALSFSASSFPFLHQDDDRERQSNVDKYYM